MLTPARGHDCHKEHQQHLVLAAFYPKIAVAYTQWTVLSDPGRTVQKDLDIQEYTDPEHDPMIPHTLVFKPGLVIHRGRPSVLGLRERRDAGDGAPFHGWNKRAGQRPALL